MTNLTKVVNIEETQQKLYENLKASGWASKLKSFILSEDFTKILLALLKDAQEGARFTPTLRQVFRAFTECPYEKLQVIICGQDVYPAEGEADGIAFSCSNTGKPAASLRYIFKEIEDTVYPKKGYKWDPDLKRLSNQGVLLLNTALTTTIGKIGTHYEIWRPFLTFLFDMLSYNNPGLVYCYLGKIAQGWMDSVPDEGNHKLIAPHPASASYRDQDAWSSDDLFNKINQKLKLYNNTKIIW